VGQREVKSAKLSVYGELNERFKITEGGKVTFTAQQGGGNSDKRESYASVVVGLL